MRRLAIIMSLLLLSLMTNAQQLRLDMVSTDSLVNFLRAQYGEKIYFVADKQDKTLFTLSAGRSEFLKAALSELTKKGYTISNYDDGLYILRGKGLATELPLGYFSEGSSESQGLLDYINESNTLANFQNKVYQIGVKTPGQKEGRKFVSGYIKNAATSEPVIGAVVMSEDRKNYAISDAFGHYSIGLPEGDNVIKVSGYSMDDMELNLFVCSDGGLDIEMKEKVVSLKGAVVTSESHNSHRDPAMGVEKVSINVIKTIPSAFGEVDIIRAVTALAGVKTVGEGASGFNVRGGSADQNLILFNEGTVYNPSHMFGIISSFDSEIISSVQLYKSSVPAEFGGRISSVMDIKGRQGNAQKVSGSLGLGLLTSRFHIEGPFKKEKTTFILSGRTTYSNWIMKLLPKSSGYSGGKASFSDISGGISHKFSEKSSIQAFAYWSRDRFSFQGDTVFRYNNIDASIKYRQSIGRNTGMTLSATYDRYANRMDNFESDFNAYTYGTIIQQVSVKDDFKTILGKHLLGYGFQANYYLMNPGDMTPSGEKSLITEKHLATEMGVEPAIYMSDTWTINEKFSVDMGLRVSGFTSLKDKKFFCGPEGRISLKYSPLKNLSVKAGFNNMRQNIHLICNNSSISPMDSWKLSEAGIKPQTGWQAATGVYWTIGDTNVELSLEGYYKMMYNYLDYRNGAVLVMNENLVNELTQAKGRAYGIELQAKREVGKITGWLSYTYARTQLKDQQDRGIEAINGGKWYSAAHDKPHEIKFVGNYKITHRFSVSCNIDYSTGRPVTIPVGKYWYDGGYRLAYSDRNAYRLPDYFRMDLAMNVEPSPNLKKLAHLSLTFGVYNVTARKNAYSVYFTTSGGTEVSGHMISVFACPIPYINLNLKF